MPSSTHTVWILGNQLLSHHPAVEDALTQADQDQICILMIENKQLIHHRPAYAGKLVLILSAMRHYAGDLKKAGFMVDYRQAPSFSAGIHDHIREYQPAQLITMAASDYKGRQLQENLLPSSLDIPLKVLPNTQFLVGRYTPYPDPKPDQNVLLEYFYRRMRRHFDILIDDDEKPTGGSWNFDRENRQPLPEDIPLPQPRQFPADPITTQVIDEIYPDESKEPSFQFAVTRNQALQALDDFLSHRLPDFGSYEDAMTVRSDLIFHSLLSPYLNLGLLEPLEVIQAVEDRFQQGSAPINAVEGFIRQVLGWREFIYWQYWQGMPGLETANHWNADRSVPGFFWSGETTMNCLATVLKRAHTSGYNHHIERLMIISNFCTLAGIQPQKVLSWFMASYIDAYHWVMVPNVIGMGLHADGGGIGTKPYISTANYIHKMSDFCQTCSYDRRQRTGENACPYNFLYWDYLLRQEEKLKLNPRMGLTLNHLKRFDPSERQTIHKQSEKFLSTLAPTPGEQ